MSKHFVRRISEQVCKEGIMTVIRTTHLSVGAPNVGLGDGGIDSLGRFANGR